MVFGFYNFTQRPDFFRAGGVSFRSSRPRCQSVEQQIGLCQCVYIKSRLFEEPQVHFPRVIFISAVSGKPNKLHNEHISPAWLAAGILFSTWSLAGGFSFPMSELRGRGSLSVSQRDPRMYGGGEGAGLRLLPGVRQAGGGTLRGLHPEVRHRPQVLPRRGR